MGAGSCAQGRRGLGREELQASCRAGISVRQQERERRNGKYASAPWVRVEPRDNAVDIHGGGDGDVLQVGLRQAQIRSVVSQRRVSPGRASPSIPARRSVAGLGEQDHAVAEAGAKAIEVCPEVGRVPVTGTSGFQGQKDLQESHPPKPKGCGWTTEVDDKSYSCRHPRIHSRVFCPRTKNSIMLTG